MNKAEPETRLGVIDVGSNSARLVVLGLRPRGHLEVRADARSALRLVRDLDRHGAVSERMTERIVRVMRDFHAIALGTGAAQTIAVGTAALREAKNGRGVLDRIRRETGVPIRILTGRQEAATAFLGAVWGLPVCDGILVDLGGGSVQCTEFHDRRFRRSWSLPLGALRMSDRFLSAVPPSAGEVRKLRRHVAGTLAAAGIPVLRKGGVLVGTGGTVRNLAKIDDRAHEYPVPHLHGYILARRRVQELAAILSTRPLRGPTAPPGLNADRIDSIVGGSVIVETLMEILGAGDLIVSGQGLREGIAYGVLRPAPPPIRTVRDAAIRGIASRFRTWDEPAAERRRALAATLTRRFAPSADPTIRELLLCAAVVLDVGRSIDYYHRHEHTAMILRSTDLAGFSHKEVMLLAAIVEHADEEDLSVKRYRPLLGAEDRVSIDRASTILALADAIERRVPNGDTPRIRCSLRAGEAILGGVEIVSSELRFLEDRVRRAFGRKLRFVLIGPGRAR